MCDLVQCSVFLFAYICFKLFLIWYHSSLCNALFLPPWYMQYLSLFSFSLNVRSQTSTSSLSHTFSIYFKLCFVNQKISIKISKHLQNIDTDIWPQFFCYLRTLNVHACALLFAIPEIYFPTQ